MKTIILALVLSLNTLAAEISITGPCAKEPIITQEMGYKFNTVGDLSIHFMDQNKIPYQGSERGFNSIYNTPVGDAAIEVISNTEMRAYGWCYFVDGTEPGIFADEIVLVNSIKKIEWVFSFAHYKDGKWIAMCEAAYSIKPDFLCK